MDERAAKAESSLYDTDFYSWTEQQARLLRSGRLDALDVTNILEEIETLGRSERASLKSAYRLICSHLLKMLFQPQKCTRSWFNTVDRERSEVADILAENPGLRPRRDEAFVKAFALARKDAARETGLSLMSFPEQPPFTVAECESPAFLPNGLGESATGKKSGKGRTTRPMR